MGWPSWAESSDWTALGSDHGNDPRAFSWGGTPEHGPGYRESLIDHPTAVSLPARSDIRGPKPLSRIGGSVVHEHGPDGAGPPPSPPGRSGTGQAFAWLAMVWEPRPRARSRRMRSLIRSEMERASPPGTPIGPHPSLTLPDGPAASLLLSST